MELQLLMRQLKSWAWLITLCAVIAGGMGFFVSRQLSPIYRATSTVLISERQPGDGASPAGAALAQTYLQLLERRPVLEQISARAGVPFDPQALARRLRAETVEGTQLLSLSADAPSAAQSALLATAVAETLQASGTTFLGPEWRRVRVTIVEPAVAPAQPIFPRTPLNSAIAALLGGLVGAGLLMLRRALVGPIETADDLRHGTGLTPLGMVPRVPARTPATGLVVEQHPDSQVAEVFRHLRARLALQLPASQPWTLAVTSAYTGDGKSTVASNLAAAIAQTGREVILVDANLRRPALHTLFGQPGEGGLTTVLRRGTDDVGAYLIATAVPGLHLLPAGPPGVAPAELLASPRLAALVTALRARADIVILDCGPALAVADGLEVARTCDAALLVARRGATRVVDLVQTRELLGQAQVAVVGAVLNAAPARGTVYADMKQQPAHKAGAHS